MQDTEWKDGQLKRVGVKQNAAVMKQARLGWVCRVWAPERERKLAECNAFGDSETTEAAGDLNLCPLRLLTWRQPCNHKRMGANLCVSLQIEQCQKGVRQGRLYVTDGSMPDYQVQQYPQDAPGKLGHFGGTELLTDLLLQSVKLWGFLAVLHVLLHWTAGQLAPSTWRPNPSLHCPPPPRRHALWRGRARQRDDAACGALQPCHQPVPHAQGKLGEGLGRRTVQRGGARSKAARSMPWPVWMSDEWTFHLCCCPPLKLC